LAGPLKIIVAGEAFVDLYGVLGIGQLTVQVAIKMVPFPLVESNEVQLETLLVSLETLEEGPCVGHVHEKTTTGTVPSMAASTGAEHVVAEEVANGRAFQAAGLTATVITNHIPVITVFTIVDDLITTAGEAAVLPAGIRPVITVVVTVVAGFHTITLDMPVTADRTTTVVNAGVRVVIVSVITLFAGLDMAVAAADLLALPISTDLITATSGFTFSLHPTGAAAAIAVDHIPVIAGLNTRLEKGVTTASVCTVPVW